MEFEHTYTVTHIIIPNIGKSKKMDDWENQSIDSDLETDSDDIWLMTINYINQDNSCKTKILYPFTIMFSNS